MKPLNQELWRKAINEGKKIYKLPASITSYAIIWYINKGGSFKK